MDTFTFAMGPWMLDEDGDELRQRFCEQLRHALRRPVRAHVARSYSEVATSMVEGDAHLAWLPPAVFVRLEHRTRVHMLAGIERAHGAEYRGVLFVAAGSDVRELEDLAGKRAAWVDPDSCAGHLFPRLALRERGIDPGAIFAQQRFVGSHGSVVHAVQSGEADVGATYAQVGDDASSLTIAGWYPYAGAAGMRAVLTSSAIPSDLMCASRRLDPDSLDALREALLGLHERGGKELIDELFGGRSFVPVHSADYDPVRAAMV